jgi:tetratricopeptide (TPR) repeat protein
LALASSSFAATSAAIRRFVPCAPRPPPKVPDHALLRLIGAGSYGEVWLARTALGSLRAVKVVYRDSFDHDRPYEREFAGIKQFEPISHARESQVDIFHVGRNDAAGYFYYIMELADDANAATILPPCAGSASLSRTSHSPLGTLHSYVPRTLKHDLRARGALPVAECVRIGLSLTRALEHLHAHGLVHRDIKPSNIIFVRGVPKLADIGLVTSVEATRSFVGTDGYIPASEAGTQRADLYSLGKVLYELVTGKDRLEFPELPDDWRNRPDFGQLLEVNEIFTKACDEEPQARYQSAGEMGADLALLERGKSVKRQRHRARAWAVCWKGCLAALVFALAAAGIACLGHGAGHIQPKDPKVKKLMDQAWFLSYDITKADKLAKLCRDAIALEPDYAPAWAGLLSAYMEGADSSLPPADRDRRFREVKDQLARLAPDCAEAHLARAVIAWNDWQFPAALEEARQSVLKREVGKAGLNNTHCIYGFYLLQSGRPDEALEEYERAEKADGADPYTQNQLGHPYFVKGDLREAMKHYEAVLDLSGSFWQAHLFRGMVFEEQKDFLAAIEEFEKADLGRGMDQAKTAHFYTELRQAFNGGEERGYWKKRLELALEASPQDEYYIATLYARLGPKSKAYDWLRQACDHKAFREGLLFDRCWDHNDKEFQATVRSIGLLK